MLCVCLLDIQKGAARGSILLLGAFFQRTNNNCAPLYRFSLLNLSYIAFIMPQQKSTYAPSALSFCLNFCAVLSPFTRRNFSHKAALNSVLKRNTKRKFARTFPSLFFCWFRTYKRTSTHKNGLCKRVGVSPER